MSINILAAAFVLAGALSLPGRAAPSPSPRELLQRSLAVPSVAYEGEMTVSMLEGGRSTTREVLVRFKPPASYRREILDRIGFVVFTIVSNGRVEWVFDRRQGVAWKGEPADPDYKLLDPDEEIALLNENYEFKAAGAERVADRPCQALDMFSRRQERRLQRLCVDAASGVVLSRESFANDGRRLSDVRFLRFQTPARMEDTVFDFLPPHGTRVAASRLKPDYLRLEEAASATAMRPRLPEWVPPGFVFESVNLLAYKGATLLHYRYSDGIDVLSLFQAPAHVRLDFGGWGAERRVRNVDLGNGRAELAFHPSGKILEWIAADRFILIGSQSLESMRRVAASVSGSPRRRGAGARAVPAKTLAGRGGR